MNSLPGEPSLRERALAASDEAERLATTSANERVEATLDLLTDVDGTPAITVEGRFTFGARGGAAVIDLERYGDFDDDIGYPDDEDDEPPCTCDVDGAAFCGYHGDEPAFADPGGTSALRAATRSNPRNLPCRTCGAENALTPADRARGYQCDGCADRAEGGGW